MTDEDHRKIHVLFESCGLTDEIVDEDQIDHFTALTGPVPGFVAYFADCMAAYAKKRGIDARIAERAVRQLFLASGDVLGKSDRVPGDYVEEMIRYAGTTAAGLEVLKRSPLSDAVAEGLCASYEKARRIADGE